jgi:hypothetical protein
LAREARDGGRDPKNQGWAVAGGRDREESFAYYPTSAATRPAADVRARQAVLFGADEGDRLARRPEIPRMIRDVAADVLDSKTGDGSSFFRRFPDAAGIKLLVYSNLPSR